MLQLLSKLYSTSLFTVFVGSHSWHQGILINVHPSTQLISRQQEQPNKSHRVEEKSVYAYKLIRRIAYALINLRHVSCLYHRLINLRVYGDMTQAVNVKMQVKACKATLNLRQLSSQEDYLVRQ